jgi:hypothetical protein
MAKSRIEVVSSMAFMIGRPLPSPMMRPMIVEAKRNSRMAKRTGRYFVDRCTSAATRATRAATASVLVVDAMVSPRDGSGVRERKATPATRGAATITSKLKMM